MTYYAQDEDLGDLSGVTADDSYSPFPAGQYLMQAIKTELKESSKGGRYVSVQFEVLGPQAIGRRTFENFNIMNSNPQTVEIALKQIKQWVMACGYTGEERLTMAMLRDLEGKEFVGQVKIEPDKTGQYGDKNRIVKYMSANSGAVPQQQATTSQADYAKATGRPPVQPAAQAANKMPWMAGR